MPVDTLIAFENAIRIFVCFLYFLEVPVIFFPYEEIVYIFREK